MIKRKKVIVTAIVAVLVVILGCAFGYNSLKNDKNGKGVSVVSKEKGQQKGKETSSNSVNSNKANGKSSDNKSSGTSTKNSTGTSNTKKADIVKDNIKTSGESANIKDKPIEYKGKIEGYVKAATIGALTKVSATISGKNDSNVAYYQVYYNSKPISNLISVDKQTTVYPAKNVGDTVIVKLVDKNKKYIGEQKVKYSKLE